MKKKASQVFKSIRFAKLDPKHENGHIGGSTDDEQHYTVGEKEFNQQVAHAKKRAMQESGGEVVYKKGNHHIEKYGEDSFALYSNGKKQKFYISMKAAKEAMNEEVEQIDEVSSDLVKRARDAAFTKGKEDQGHRFVRKAYEKGQKESEAMAKKINEVSNELLQRYKEKAGKQIDNPATPSATKLKRGIGHLKATSKQMTSGKPMPEEVEMQEEMDYNVKVSHTTADGENVDKVYKVSKAKDHRHAQNIALNKHTAALDKAGTKFTRATATVIREDLRKWFDKDHPEGGWKRINSKGEAIGPCAREPGEPKPKCMSNEKRASLSKKERAAAVAAKRKHDPNPERKGEPINVSNYGKGKLGEEVEQLDEKNVPTSPEKWARAKAMAKSKFDVYPSAYANGWAAKKYKEMGGGWKSVSEAKEEPPFEGGQPAKQSAVAGKYGKGYSTARHLARMALKKQQEKMKPLKKVNESKKAEIVKRIAKKNVSDDKFQAEPTLDSKVQKTNDVDPFINK